MNEQAQYKKSFLIFLPLFIISMLPYFSTFWNIFSNDDWLLIYYYKDFPIFPPFKFFTNEVVWFYRPLQNLLLGLLYHTSALNPLYYNLLDFFIFFLSSILWFNFILRFFKTPAIALLSITFFLFNWEYCEVIFWKSNLGTLLSWLGLILSLQFFYSYLTTDKKIYNILTTLSFIFALLSKESSVIIPFILFLIFLYLENENSIFKLNKNILLKGFKKCSIHFLILVIYLLLHHYWVKDIRTVSVKLYKFSSPLLVLKNFLFALNHCIFFFADSPFIRELNPIWKFLRDKFLILPIIIFIYGLIKKDRIIIFGMTLASLTLFPQILLEVFHSSRFYLVPITGMSIVLAGLFLRSFIFLKDKDIPLLRISKLMLIIFAIFTLLSSQLSLYTMIAYENENMKILGKIFDELKNNRNKFPEKSCFYFNVSESVSNNGLGLREMVKLALNSDAPEAFKIGQKVSEERVKMIENEFPNKYNIYLDNKGGVIISKRK